MRTSAGFGGITSPLSPFTRRILRKAITKSLTEGLLFLAGRMKEKRQAKDAMEELTDLLPVVGWP